MRVIYSRADVRKVQEYRENLNSAFRKFEVRHRSSYKLNVSSDTLVASISDEYRPKSEQDFGANTVSDRRGH